jgi:hypothetical protein
MYYIVQENLFREEGHAKLISNLDRFNIPYELVRITKAEEIEFKTDRKDVFCFGAMKMARLSKKYGWVPGALITENHDYSVYSKYYKDNLLNYDSKIMKIGELKDFDGEKFIRPCLDSKIFTGKVFNKYDWEETHIQVANPKDITQEVRFWIVDGKIVTQSTYRRGSFLIYDDIVDQDSIDFVQKMIKLYEVEKCFTIDVCLTIDNEWKIVECGSVSCAGFYDADMQKLIIALENAYN